jgi:hypothetical protein
MEMGLQSDLQSLRSVDLFARGSRGEDREVVAFVGVPSVRWVLSFFFGAWDDYRAWTWVVRGLSWIDSFSLGRDKNGTAIALLTKCSVPQRVMVDGSTASRFCAKDHNSWSLQSASLRMKASMLNM